MSKATVHPLRLQLRGCLRMLQGWLLRDTQRVLLGRCDVLLGQVEHLHQRVNSGRAMADLSEARLSL